MEDRFKPDFCWCNFVPMSSVFTSWDPELPELFVYVGGGVVELPNAVTKPLKNPKKVIAKVKKEALEQEQIGKGKKKEEEEEEEEKENDKMIVDVAKDHQSGFD